MKRHKTIHYRNIPDRIPLGTTAIIWLLGDRLHFHEWAWTLAIVIVVIRWAAFFVNAGTEILTNIFPGEGD